MEKLSERISVRFRPSTIARFEQVAERRGVPLRTVVRRLAANRKIVPREEVRRLEEVRQELRAIGRNLNQLTRHAHRESKYGEPVNALAINAAIEETRGALRGLEERTESKRGG